MSQQHRPHHSPSGQPHTSGRVVDNRLLRSLSTDQLTQYAADVEQAIESHIRWLAAVNRVLLCHTPPNPDDLCEHPHTLCQFGIWHANVAATILAVLPEFDHIGEVHREMHASARKLLVDAWQNPVVSPREYDRLINLSNELHLCLKHLKRHFSDNLNIISRLMSKVFENAAEGVIITDPQARIQGVNSAFSNISGYHQSEVVGHTPAILRSGRHTASFYRTLWDSLIREGQWAGEIWNRRKGGDEYLEWLSIAAVRNEQGLTTHYVGIISDITSAHESAQQLHHLAHYDPLTQLPNRVLLRDRVNQLITASQRNQQQFALLFIDLDGFKSVNDRHGHSCGDDLLREVALRLRGVLRESDTVARLSGDEFIILLPDLQRLSQLGEVAQKLLEVLRLPFEQETCTLSISGSIGISSFPRDGASFEQLLTRADSAMYVAKHQGKNQFQIFTTVVGSPPSNSQQSA